MSLIIEYVASLAPWIYGLCGLIALYYLYRVRAIRMERRQAIFALERERAARAVAHILSRVTGLILLMSAAYFISHVMARAVEMEQDVNGNTVDEVVVPNDSVAILPPTPAAAATDVVAAEGVLELRSVPTCEDENATILTPGVEQEITDVVAMIGTATHENFSAFYVEIAPGTTPEDNDFTLLGIGRNQVRSGYLLDIDTTPYISGLYSLRMRVIDVNGEYVAACQVTVRIVSS